MNEGNSQDAALFEMSARRARCSGQPCERVSDESAIAVHVVAGEQTHRPILEGIGPPTHGVGVPLPQLLKPSETQSVASWLPAGRRRASPTRAWTGEQHRPDDPTALW